MLQRRLTSVGKLFIGLMFLFYVASVTSQSGLLLMLIGLIAGCFIVNWSFATRNALHLKVTAPSEIHLEEWALPTQPWRFDNPMSKHAEVVEVSQRDQVLFRIPVVKTKESVSIVPRLVYERRGVFPNALVTLSSAAPYGLIRASRQLQLPGEVVVFPKIYDVEPPDAMGVDMISGGRSRGGRRVNHGTHFAGVRAWQAGDSLKQVHWKTTARRGEMMVKMFEEELGGRVTLILDCAPGEIKVIDDAVRAAGSLAVACLQNGHHVEFVERTDEPTLRITAFSDEGELLERLARYEPRTAARLPAVETLWRKSTIALIGNQWREEWWTLIGEARAQLRLVQIYLPEGLQCPANLDAEIFHFSDREIWPSAEVVA